MLSRREFIKLLGGLGAALMPPFHRLAQVQAMPALAQSLPPGAELYGYFLLLPEGSPVPGFVQDYKFGVPSMCGITDEAINIQGKSQQNKMTAVYYALDNARSLSAKGGFPVYTFDKLPAGIVPSGASLIAHQTGEVFGGDVTFAAYDEQESTWYTAINISIQVDFPRPFPLWFNISSEPDIPTTTLKKVDFAPGHHGILVHTPQGFALHWIFDTAYYLMTADRMPDVSVRELVSSLVLV